MSDLQKFATVIARCTRAFCDVEAAKFEGVDREQAAIMRRTPYFASIEEDDIMKLWGSDCERKPYRKLPPWARLQQDLDDQMYYLRKRAEIAELALSIDEDILDRWILRASYPNDYVQCYQVNTKEWHSFNIPSLEYDAICYAIAEYLWEE